MAFKVAKKRVSFFHLHLKRKEMNFSNVLICLQSFLKSRNEWEVKLIWKDRSSKVWSCNQSYLSSKSVHDFLDKIKEEIEERKKQFLQTPQPPLSFCHLWGRVGLPTMWIILYSCHIRGSTDLRSSSLTMTWRMLCPSTTPSQWRLQITARDPTSSTCGLPTGGCISSRHRESHCIH